MRKLKIQENPFAFMFDEARLQVAQTGLKFFMSSTPNPPVSTSRMLGFHLYTVMPGLWGAANQTQSLIRRGKHSTNWVTP